MLRSRAVGPDARDIRPCPTPWPGAGGLIRQAAVRAERARPRAAGGLGPSTQAEGVKTAVIGADVDRAVGRRVATLAARGMPNRQIARHLFITQPTVEAHLRHAFHKLGITSRTALPVELCGAVPGRPA